MSNTTQRLLCLRWSFAMPSLYLRFRFASNPFQVRSKSVPDNGTYMGFAREEEGNYKGQAKAYARQGWNRVETSGKNNHLQMWLHIFSVFKVFFALFLVLIIFFRNFAAEKDGSTGLAWPLLILFQGCILVHQLLIFKQTNYGRLSRDKH